ncbi:hypothetical protein [Mycobacterium sp.]|uniref:hypothetical protein n=1 Tax=Mycobacterium sp. TaxID=1785 RepID=UPI0031D84D68
MGTAAAAGALGTAATPWTVGTAAAAGALGTTATTLKDQQMEDTVIFLILTAVAAGAYWVGAQSKSSRIRGDRKAAQAAGHPVAPTPYPARAWLIAAAVGTVLLLAALIGAPASLGPIGGPGLFGP